MLGRLGWWRHIAVGVVIVGCAVLALLGVFSRREERFDAKQITVMPADGEGVRIREVVDQDFGTTDRHGYQRIIPHDFGRPTDVEAESPDANADLDVDDMGYETRIRLGDADITFDGQHRYILSYTLPEARLSTGVLDLDIIGPGEEFETGRIEVIVTGFELTDLECNVGSFGDVGGCALEPFDGGLRAVIEPLEKGDGVSIVGTIRGRTAVVDPPLPALPDRIADRRILLALLIVPVGAIAGAIVFSIARRRGRNEVFAGGVADAAYGRLPAPDIAALSGQPSTRLVSDMAMSAMATIEFVPPKGLQPWQGAVLLRERIDNNTVAAWFSGLAAREVITLEESKGVLTMGTGPKYSSTTAHEANVLRTLFDGGSPIRLGTYRKEFATAWNATRSWQVEAVRESGWWTRGGPGRAAGASPVALLAVAVAIVLFVGGSITSAVLGALDSPVAVLVAVMVGTAIAAWGAYAVMLPRRSATGSALALMTESFRRFLEASEGRHVEWAWQQGLLREYSAWAVSLDAADAWGRALAASNVPPAVVATSNPLLVYSMASAFSSSRTAPSSSGSGSSSSSGFSGGGSGGGGGGGSSGSW